MTANALALKWQDKLDADFPKGLLAAWDDRPGTDGGHVYLCPRPEVTGMAGLDPIIMMPCPGHDKVVQPGTISGYKEIQTTPCKLVQVTFGSGRTMAWSDGLTEAQVAHVADNRANAISLSEQAGESAWTPPPE
jgi:hypothetical protein